MQRVLSVDLLRGVFMILMAKDHILSIIMGLFFAETWYATSVHYESVGIALTRVPGLIIPVSFAFVMGISMSLFAHSRLARGWSRSKIISFFITRGLALILLQFFIINVVWWVGKSPNLFADIVLFYKQLITFNLQYYFGILYVLGASLIICSFFIYLDLKKLFAIAVLPFVVSIVYLSGIIIEPLLTHPSLGPILLPHDWEYVSVRYPIIPWIGFVFFGLACGKLLIRNALSAQKVFLLLGILFVSGALILRSTGFGNFQLHTYTDFTTFFTLSKYPPSVVFIFFGLGINLMLLALFSYIQKRNAVVYVVETFGKVPLIFYILHIYILWAFSNAFPHYDSLVWAYVFLILTLLILFPVCAYIIQYRKR